MSDIPGPIGLTAYWPLNYRQKSRSLPESASGLTLTGSATVPTVGSGSVYPWAPTFDSAITDYFQNSSASVVCLADQDFSVWWWSYLNSIPDSGKTRCVIYNHDTSDGFRIEFAYNGGSGSLEFVIKSSITEYTLTHTTIATGQWDFWCAWFDSSASTSYVSRNDGTPTSQGSVTAAGTYDTSFFIGGFTAALSYHGLIGPVAVHDRILTSDEITWIYNSGAGRKYSAFLAPANNRGGTNIGSV